MTASQPSPERGRFVVLEGAEGVGKSTQIQRLAAWLESLGLDVVQAREPGGTEVGEGIREVLLHRKDLAMPAETELLLILAARAAFVREVVEPALERGAWVLADRFDLSTFAYQGFGRGLDLDRLEDLNRFATGGLSPDLYLLLDLPVKEGRARQQRVGMEEDRIESEGFSFLERVRDGYLELRNRIPGVVLIDARESVQAVEIRIQNTLVRTFPETLSSSTGY